MKRVFLIIMVLMLLLFTGCSAKNPSLEEKPGAFYDVWDQAIQKEKVLSVAMKNYAAEYPEELNLATHPGLLTMDDFTGPIVCFENAERKWANGYYTYVPDMTAKKYMEHNELPADELKASTYISMSVFRKNYCSEVMTDEKLAAIQQRKIPVIYMVTEYTGYEGSKLYDIGPIYRRHIRNSFYRLDTGELIAWESEERHYEETDSLNTRKTVFDKYTAAHS